MLHRASVLAAILIMSGCCGIGTPTQSQIERSLAQTIGLPLTGADRILESNGFQKIDGDPTGCVYDRTTCAFPVEDRLHAVVHADSQGRVTSFEVMRIRIPL